MTSLRIILLATLLLLPTTSYSLVDMRNANFSDSWTDIEVPGGGFPLRVVRAYNSRSLYNGMFGFGWCSDLETALEVTPEGNVRILECGDGAEFVYRPREFSKDDVSAVVDAIISKISAEEPARNKATLSRLKTELINDRALRAEYGRKYKIVEQAKESTRYFANGRENEVVIKDKAGYTRSLNDGSQQKFDSNGKLSATFDKNGNFLKYTYTNGLLTEVIDNQARKMSFQYYPNRKVKAILAPNRMTATYKYKGVSDLESATNAFKETYTYTYDQLHNLTKIVFPDNTTKILTYDTNKDWVKSLKDRAGCVESYNWVLSKEDPKNNYHSTIEKKCDGKVVNKSRFEFWFKQRPDGDGKYLARTLNNVNNDVTDTTFHPQYGRPTAITRNGEKTSYEYYPNGLVSVRTVGKIVTKFKYDDATKKVVEVQTGDRKTNFKYDKAGNLTNAQSSEGLSVNLSYDERGRIVSIIDQAKRQVKITYDQKFGKPKTVERPGVGSIEVTYKPDGQIKDVKSPKGGSTVAVQVASTFNSLLELVSPAGVDLGI